MLLTSVKNLSLSYTYIIQNVAYEGGGIYIIGSDSYLTEKNLINSILLFNTAIQSTNNLVQLPDHLKLFINNQEMNSIFIKETDGSDIYQLNLKKYKFIEQSKAVETNYLFLPSNQLIQNYQRFNEETLVFEQYCQHQNKFINLTVKQLTDNQQYISIKPIKFNLIKKYILQLTLLILQVLIVQLDADVVQTFIITLRKLLNSYIQQIKESHQYVLSQFFQFKQNLKSALSAEDRLEHRSFAEFMFKIYQHADIPQGNSGQLLLRSTQIIGKVACALKCSAVCHTTPKKSTLKFPFTIHRIVFSCFLKFFGREFNFRFCRRLCLQTFYKGGLRKQSRSDLGYIVDQFTIDLRNINIIFDPYYNRLSDGKFIQLIISCPVQIGNSQQKILSYQINAKTFKCQLGEFYTNNGCQICEPNFGFYSVKYNVVKCSIFDLNKLEKTTSNQLKLREGYWRPHYHSDLIEQCFKNQKSCIGGWKVNNDLCIKGHIGGLCEECDSYNIRGNGNFVKISNTECGNCDDIYSFLPFFFILIWQISMLSKVLYYNFVNSKEYKQWIYLVNDFNVTFFQLKKIIGKIITPFLSTLLERRTNNLQFQKILQSYIQFYLNQLKNFKVFSLKCFLITFGFFLLFSLLIQHSSFLQELLIQSPAQIFQQPPIQIASSFIQAITPQFIQDWLLLLFFLLFSFFLLLPDLKYISIQKKKNLITVSFQIFQYIYMFQIKHNQLKAQVHLLLFAQFRVLIMFKGMQLYFIMINFIHFDRIYQQIFVYYMIWVYVIILPCLIITGLIIPLFFTLVLVLYKNQFFKPNFRKHFAYLFNEYNVNCSYWEQMKILQRSIIIIIITYFEIDIYIKASLISLTLIIYNIHFANRKPYIISSLNNLDFESCSIILISIFLATVEHISQLNNNTILSAILQSILLIIFLRICYCFISRIIYFYYKNQKLKIFLYLSNLSYKLFKNTTLTNYLKKQYQINLLMKQKLRKNFQKLRESKSLYQQNQLFLQIYFSFTLYFFQKMKMTQFLIRKKVKSTRKIFLENFNLQNDSNSLYVNSQKKSSFTNKQSSNTTKDQKK